MSAFRTIRVLLADDHEMVRDGLKRLINEQPDMDVVAEADDGPEARRLAETHAPDVALVDVSMPGWDGVTLAQELTRTCPRVRIIAVTRHGEGPFVKKMLAAGAMGYVLKQSASSELVRAVRAVAEGKPYIDPAVKMIDIPPVADAHDRPAAREGEPLTSDEEQVLRLIARAWTHQRIAEELAVDVAGVLALRSSGTQKAGLITRMQIVEYARAQGWLVGGRELSTDS